MTVEQLIEKLQRMPPKAIVAYGQEFHIIEGGICVQRKEDQKEYVNLAPIKLDALGGF